ncbi:sigma-54-dependent Fis family transcriptional regulator [Hymenobacter terrenus]|uniref:sigma-54-dependent Fis family transcriptional regulator n=1 Tax=Hymenobacter terrenus TaxID=1629124 RepID=UPI0006962DFA|nr:sigma 54-interacting transcriptional regulator [Hymenobacter terrenus]
MQPRIIKPGNGNRTAADEREKAMLLAVSQAIATVRDKQELLGLVLEKIKPIFGFYDCGLFVLDADGQHHSDWTALLSEIDLAAANTGLRVADLSHHPHSGSIIEAHMQQAAAGPLILDFEVEMLRQPNYSSFALTLAGGYREVMAGLLQVGGQPMGMFYVNSQQSAFFCPEQLPKFQAIVDQMAVAVANILANEELRAREREKSVLLSISGAIATVRNAVELLAVIREKAQELLPFFDTSILLVEKDGLHHYDLAATLPGCDSAANNHELHTAGLPRVAHPDSYVAHVMELLARTGAPLIENYERRFTEFGYSLCSTLHEVGYREGIVTELRLGGSVLGTFWLNALAPGAFRLAQFEVFQALADQVAGAVANILAHEDIAAREREKTVQLALNNALVSSKNRESMCRALAEQMNQLVPFSLFVLCIWPLDDDSRYQVTLRRQPDGQFASMQREVVHRSPPPLSMAQRMRLFERPGLFTGADFEALCREYPLYRFVSQQFGVRSHLRLSLNSLAGTQASIVISGMGPTDFRPADYQTLLHLVPQISLALNNLLAFERLEQQRREKAAQVAITNVLTSELAFNELVRELAPAIDSLVPCDLLHLCLLPPHTTVPAADIAVVKEAGGFRALSWAEVNDHQPTEALATSCDELRALTNETRLYVGDEVSAAIGLTGLLRYFHDAQGMRALLLVPLRVAGRVAAGLLLGHRFSYGFSPTDVVRVEALAGQMALALGHRFAYAEIAALKEQLEEENSYLQDEIKTTHNFEEIIGASPPLVDLFRQVGQVAGTDTTVCIGGETGTGKELIARAIHNLSPRRDRRLIKVNCAALPALLIESELFGHEKGSFTGAVERRIGKFELAHGSSIFLDEIGELPLELQAKLLRVLQEKEVERVGGKGPIACDVRIIAATNRDLEQEVRAGRFRQDLYFRLLVFPLLLPPLRERKEDIPALATHFLFQFTKKMGKPHKGISAAALREMMTYDWPGNIRELQHVLEQAVIVSTKPLLELARPLRPAASASVEHCPAFRRLSLNELERQHIVATLRHTNGRIRGAGGTAELLNIKATTLEARMKKLGISKRYAVTS